MPDQSPAGTPPRSETRYHLGYRFLRLFADIRQGEAGQSAPAGPERLSPAPGLLHPQAAARSAPPRRQEGAPGQELPQRGPGHPLRLRHQGLQPSGLQGPPAHPHHLDDVVLHLQPRHLLFPQPGRHGRQAHGDHVLHLDRHLQLFRHRPVLGLRQRPLFRRGRKADLSARRPGRDAGRSRRDAPHHETVEGHPGEELGIQAHAHRRGRPVPLHRPGLVHPPPGGPENPRGPGKGPGRGRGESPDPGTAAEGRRRFPAHLQEPLSPPHRGHDRPLQFRQRDRGIHHHQGHGRPVDRRTRLRSRRRPGRNSP